MGWLADALIEAKQEQLEQRQARTSLLALRAVARMQDRPVPFLTHVGGWTAIIGQVQYRIPLTGDLSTRYDPARLARKYVAGGANAVSVFTDTVIHRDGMTDLTIVHDMLKRSNTPVISQDYVLDEYHVVEARAAGASVVVLTSGIVSSEALRNLTSVVHRNRMTAVVTVFNEQQLNAALTWSPQVIGVAGRTPTDYQVDCDFVEYIMKKIPPGQRVMICSPLGAPQDINRMAMLGVHAITVSQELLMNESSHDELVERLQRAAS